MRALVLILAACGGGAADPVAPPTEAPTPKTAPPCTKLAAEPLEMTATGVRDIVWRSPTEVIVAVGDRDKQGLAVYDLSKPSGSPATTYRIAATQLALGGNTLFAVASDRVSAIDLATMCIRRSEPLELAHVAIDTKRGRVFAITRTAFVRIDGPDLRVAVDVAAPRQVAKMSYDPASDRVVVRSHGKTVELYDGKTLAAAGTFPIVDVTRDGPWIRPGVAEAWFVYDVFCKKREFDHMPMRKSLGKCLDDPKTVGSFLTRYELPAGKLVETIHFTGGEATFGEGNASFSGDGKQLMVGAVSHAHLQTIGGAGKALRQLSTTPKPEYEWGDGEIFPVPIALDETGARFAGGFYGYHFRIGDTLTGKIQWRAPLPGTNPY